MPISGNRIDPWNPANWDDEGTDGTERTDGTMGVGRIDPFESGHFRRKTLECCTYGRYVYNDPDTGAYFTNTLL